MSNEKAITSGDQLSAIRQWLEEMEGVDEDENWSMSEMTEVQSVYDLIRGVESCEHLNFDDYFEQCDDCGMVLEDMPEEVQKAYRAQYEEED